MKVLGITAEYNPLHNGHIYHLEKSRVMSKADFVVAVMSGDFTQRGEPAAMDKWSRAEAAVKCGVDVVFELPFIFATSSAEGFARGSVSIFEGLGCITDISFGSESGDLESMKRTADFLAAEPADYRQALRENLDRGDAFPAAREKAAAKLLGSEAGSLLKDPNNILGIEYLKALAGSRGITPHTVRRIGSYNDGCGGEDGVRQAAETAGKMSSGCLAGAAYIRRLLLEGRTEAVKELVPAETAGLEGFKRAVSRPLTPEKLWPLIRSRILCMSAGELALVYGAEEGLENRLKKFIRQAGSLEEYTALIKTKRYTRTNISRLLLHVLVGMQKNDAARSAEYARILAAGTRGRDLLRHIGDSGISSLPVINNINREFQGKKQLPRSLELDILAADLYNLAAGLDLYRNSDQVRQPYIE